MIAFPALSQAGRLGNQLWQIAATVGLATRVGVPPKFPPWDYQPFFRCATSWFGDIPADAVDATTLVSHLDHRAAPYLQDYSLFAYMEADVKRWFQPSDRACEVLSDIWETTGFGDLEAPLTSLHVRRGDNVTHPQGYHPLRSMQYYRDALALLPSDGSLVCFTDDPQWCWENLERELGRDVALIYEGVARPREYVDRQLYLNAPVLDWIDLQLMAACDRHILSNSTYAWWGAFLSQDESPIYPSNWFGVNVRSYTDSTRMFPDLWREVPDITEGGI